MGEDYSNSYNKSIKFLLIIMVLLLIIIGGLFLYKRFNDLKNVDTTDSSDDYYIVYNTDDIPGSKNEVSISGNQIKINITNFCSAVNCEPSKEEKVYNYSDENINKLKKFINSNFSEKNITINEHELSKRNVNIMNGILFGEYFFETNIEDYKYKIEYSRSKEITYDIYFKEDNSILVKKCSINSNYDITKIDTFSVSFSNDNMKKLFNYIENELKDSDKDYLYKGSSLKKDDANIINSIIENNESLLNKDIKLLYTISYKGINCITPTLYLYNDNTYEFFDKLSINNSIVTPKTGNYNYDMSKLISNVDKYKEDVKGPYSIVDENGKSYKTYSTNTELKELESSLGIKLDKCMEQ